MLARRFATHMSDAGVEVLNDVVLNQALVSFGSDEMTSEVMRRAREDGTAWFSGTRWRGRAAMRVSVSCWATEEDDIDRSAEAVLRIAGELGRRPTRPLSSPASSADETSMLGVV